MLKNKYQRMSKTAKKRLKDDFYNTDHGKSFQQRYIRVTIIGILCLIYALYLIIDNYINNSQLIIYIYATITLLAGTIFIISINRIRGKLLNEFSIKTKKE